MVKKILIIEDDKTVRENLQSLLTEEGYMVFASRDGEKGILAAKKEIPDLIICDIMMPGKDGYAVLKELSDDNDTRGIPFVFLTAKVEKMDIRMGMNLGADDYLFKPFDADDLLKAISSRLKKKEVLKAEFEHPENKKKGEKYALDDKIFIQVNSKTYLVNIPDIKCITAEKQYTSIKTAADKSYILRRSISSWERMLPEKKFLRIHRSTIINIDYLVKMETWFNSSYLVYLKNIDKPFVISRRYSGIVRVKLLK